MPVSRYRLTNGQRAAVCGLQIAGVSLTQACEIVGVPYQGMRDLLGPWHTKMHTRPKWKGYLVAEVHEAWRDSKQKAVTIAARYGTSTRQLSLLAGREGWGKRKPGPPRGKHSFLSMTPEKRLRYWKLARVLGHKSATSIVAEEFR